MILPKTARLALRSPTLATRHAALLRPSSFASSAFLARSFASSDQQQPSPPPPKQERKSFKREDDWSYSSAADPMNKLSEEEIAQLKRELGEEQRKLHIGTYAIIGGGLLAVGVIAWLVVTFVPKKSSVESS